MFHAERNMWKETFSDIRLVGADLHIIFKWQKSYEGLQDETQGKN
jgi:hypothetical protein